MHAIFFETIAVSKSMRRKKTKETKKGHFYFYTFESLTLFLKTTGKKTVTKKAAAKKAPS